MEAYIVSKSFLPGRRNQMATADPTYLGFCQTLLGGSIKVDSGKAPNFKTTKSANQTREKVCAYFQKGQCTRNNCTFKHEIIDLTKKEETMNSTANTENSSKGPGPCKFYQQGRCSRKTCAFSHDVEVQIQVEEKDEEDDLHCSLCAITLPSAKAFRSHMLSMMHSQKLMASGGSGEGGSNNSVNIKSQIENVKNRWDNQTQNRGNNQAQNIGNKPVQNRWDNPSRGYNQAPNRGSTSSSAPSLMGMNVSSNKNNASGGRNPQMVGGGCKPDWMERISGENTFNQGAGLQARPQSGGVPSRMALVVNRPSTSASREMKDDGDPRNPFYCRICNINSPNQRAYQNHCRGLIHTQQLMAEEQQSGTMHDACANFEDSAPLPGTCRNAQGGLSITDPGALPRGLPQVINVKPHKDSEPRRCEICVCVMTGKKAYDSHMEGAKHRKNVKNKAMGIVSTAGTYADVIKLAPDIPGIARAQGIVDKYQGGPLIGLQHITEFVMQDTPNADPKYVCNMCETKCDINTLIPHSNGTKHRLHYLKEHYMNFYTIIRQTEVRKSELATVLEGYARDIENEEGRMKIRVKYIDNVTLLDRNAEALLQVAAEEQWQDQYARHPPQRTAGTVLFTKSGDLHQVTVEEAARDWRSRLDDVVGNKRLRQIAVDSGFVSEPKSRRVSAPPRMNELGLGRGLGHDPTLDVFARQRALSELDKADDFFQNRSVGQSRINPAAGGGGFGTGRDGGLPGRAFGQPQGLLDEVDPLIKARRLRLAGIEAMEKPPWNPQAVPSLLDDAPMMMQRDRSSGLGRGGAGVRPLMMDMSGRGGGGGGRDFHDESQQQLGQQSRVRSLMDPPQRLLDPPAITTIREGVIDYGHRTMERESAPKRDVYGELRQGGELLPAPPSRDVFDEFRQGGEVQPPPQRDVFDEFRQGREFPPAPQNDDEFHFRQGREMPPPPPKDVFDSFRQGGEVPQAPQRDVFDEFRQGGQVPPRRFGDEGQGGNQFNRPNQDRDVGMQGGYNERRMVIDRQGNIINRQAPPLPPQAPPREPTPPPLPSDYPPGGPGGATDSATREFANMIGGLSECLVSTEDEAAMALQVSNALTQALINFRMKVPQ